MGVDTNGHDNWAGEPPGPINARSTENLGVTEKAIIANRRLLMQAIDAVEAGKEPVVTLDGVTGPMAIDTMASTGDWQVHWKEADRARRTRSPWATAREN